MTKELTDNQIAAFYGSYSPDVQAAVISSIQFGRPDSVCLIMAPELIDSVDDKQDEERGFTSPYLLREHQFRPEVVTFFTRRLG